MASAVPPIGKPMEPERGGLIDLPMYEDPHLDPPATQRSFHPRLASLWLEALGRDDGELRIQAAEAFAAASKVGFEPDSATAGAVLAALENEKDPQVRLSLVKALAAFDDAAVAGVLLAEVTGTRDPEVALVIDRALADWKHEPAYTAWTERLASDATEPLKLSAVRALAQVKHAPAREPLLAIVQDPRAGVVVRTAAAEALGEIATSGLVEAAAQLAQGDRIDRTAAATMLASHDLAAAEPVLRQLAGDRDASVAAMALVSLNRIDPSAVASSAEPYLGHADPNVRLRAVEAVAARPSAAAVTQLIPRLDDVSVTVRHTAREALMAFAQTSELSAAVRDAATASLQSAGWRGIEQAALLLGALDHEPAADALVTLLPHERPEVRLAAAEALRRLEVAETLPALLQRAEEITSQLIPDQAEAFTDLGNEASAIFQLFGVMKYEPADELLRRYVPKDSRYPALARGAAVYALSKLYEGKLDEALAKQLAGRLSDVNPMDPEMPQVRRFSAITLGRMKASAQKGVLERFYNEENASEDLGGACRWALIQITGQELPPLIPIDYRQTGWFLEPTN